MQKTHLEHPSDEALERFVLHQSQDDEVEVLETHILGCDTCVTRLEQLDVQVAAIKLALQDMQSEETAKAEDQAADIQRSWMPFRWTLQSKWTMAGALATFALGLALVPQVIQHQAPLADVQLSAYRGAETTIVPEGRPLHIQLNATDLPHGPVAVTVVDNNGLNIWKGTAEIANDRAQITLPALTGTGAHYLRISTAGQPDGELLREFAFQVKP